jgi:3-hexulose-6-phosphate synthase/6-phospho-3-hexuloisomerase
MDPLPWQEDMPRPKIQVALDITCMSEALLIAQGAVEGGADWIEAGTPLIKKQGMEVVRRLVDTCGGRVIVADMKTMDAGRLEAEMAISAGAKVITVCGLADDLTIEDAVRAAEPRGAAVMVDMINAKDAVGRAIGIQQFGAHYICLHTGLDAQARDGGVAGSEGLIRDLSSRLKVPLAVGGGITAGNARRVAEAGAAIIIVGSYVTKARDPASAVRSIIEAVS